MNTELIEYVNRQPRIGTLSTVAAWASEPKYVFFFLGDGMANSQIQATEAYLTTIWPCGTSLLPAFLLLPPVR